MPQISMITPEWSPQSSWQLTSSFISTKTSMDAAMGFVGFLGSPTAPLSSNLQGFTTKWGKITAFQDGHHFDFHYWRSQKKNGYRHRQVLETSAGAAFFLCLFFFACVILSLYHRSFLLLAMKHLKQSHSDCDIVKSMSKNTPTSTLWPGKHLIFCAFASLQGLEIFLKHCRSNLMLHCQIPSDAWLFQAKTVQPIS